MKEVVVANDERLGKITAKLKALSDTITNLRSGMEEQQVSANQAVPNVDEKESEHTEIETAIDEWFEDEVKVIKEAKIHYKRCEKAMGKYNRWFSKLSELVNTKRNNDIKLRPPNIHCKSWKDYLEHLELMHNVYQTTLLSISIQCRDSIIHCTNYYHIIHKN